MNATQEFSQHASPLNDADGRVQDLLMVDRFSGVGETPLFAEFADYNAKVTLPLSVHQFEGHHAQRDTTRHFLVSTGRSYAMMPLEINRPVKRILDYYQYDIHNRFQQYLDRFEKYKNLVQRVFREVGLPTELGYLSLVESGFNPRALSRARASGPWQFMKPTGITYGLNVTWYVDERRDPVKSTVAAAHHLKDLFDQYQSWPLALAAYNAGGPKISQAIRKSGSRDFWEIRETEYIMQETKDYVPSFIAAVLIASNPTRYGFKVNTTSPYTYDEVLVHKRAHLKAVADTTGISFKKLKELNPELLQNIVPIVEVGYSLKVPLDKGLLVREHHDQIQKWTKLPPESATWYHVRFGETLDDVAEKLGLSVQELRRLNNLKEDDLIFWKDRLRLRTDDDSAPIAIEAEPAPPPTWYHVRFGETLDDVAEKLDLPVQKLRRLNNLKKGDLIFWNNRLRVRADEDDDPSLVPKSEPAPPPTWYHVRFGETLDDVAKKLGLSVQKLRRLNNLKKGDLIFWNNRLRIRADEDDNPSLILKAESASQAAWYRVRSGDTLTSIAKQFDLSVAELKRLNNLKNDRIRSNDRLRVRPDNDDLPVAPTP
ncbi:LysM peptidoglycan-binding domain-containing protein [Candidatus Nitrospira salsa]